MASHDQEVTHCCHLADLHSSRCDEKLKDGINLNGKGSSGLNRPAIAQVSVWPGQAHKRMLCSQPAQLCSKAHQFIAGHGNTHSVSAGLQMSEGEGLTRSTVPTPSTAPTLTR